MNKRHFKIYKNIKQLFKIVKFHNISFFPIFYNNKNSHDEHKIAYFKTKEFFLFKKNSYKCTMTYVT